jgi:hypothetical protein
MNLRPEERPSDPTSIRHTGQSSTYPFGREERNAAPARSALWPASCRPLRALGVSSQRSTEAKTGETRCAGRAHSGGSDENSGNASCEAPCLPRPAAAVESAGGALAAVPRGPKVKPLPVSAGLAAAGARGAAEGVAFPDPPSDALHACAGLAVEEAWSATEWVAFPDPPSDAPDPGKTRKAASPNDPGKGRTGKSAIPMDSPNDPGKGRIGKSATIRNTVRRGSSGRPACGRRAEPSAASCPLFQPWSRWPSAKRSDRAASRCQVRGLQRERRRIGRDGRTLVLATSRTCRRRGREVNHLRQTTLSHRMGG